MNADPHEIQKFSDLAHRWWDPDVRIPPPARNQSAAPRMDQRARAAEPASKVIDIGCGGGILAESMARKGADVTGIDLSEKALKVADLHSLESGVQVRYKLIAAEDMAAQEAGQLRRRDLHGNARARARSGVDRARRRQRWSSRAARCFSRR